MALMHHLFGNVSEVEADGIKMVTEVLKNREDIFIYSGIKACR